MDSTKHNNIKLTSAEITNLWTSYMNDSGAVCQLQYFLAKCEDEDIKSVIEYALELTQSHISKLIQFFNVENHPVPYGFKLEEDVDITAPKLYSDSYVLNYIEQMGKIGLNSYSMCLSLSTREDVYNYYSECMAEVDRLILGQ